MKNKKAMKYLWVFGFLGLKGLAYFKTGDTNALFYFAYFSFFFYPLVYNIIKNTEDERMIINRRKSHSRALVVAILFLVTIGLAPSFGLFEPTTTFFIAMSAIGAAATLLTHIFSFFYFEHYSKD